MTKRKNNNRSRKNKKPSSKKRRIIRSIFLFLLLILILIYISFTSWKDQAKSKAFLDSKTVFTKLGPIEYKTIGNGPVILLSHMGGTGSDNIKLFQEIADAGYCIICPSRPGYLNTPLTTDSDIEHIASLYNELLTQLHIKEKIFVMGISAGGPSAIEFAAKYPDRCNGLILHSAITKNFSPLNEMKDFSKIINIMLSNTWQDPFGWLNHITIKIAPKKTIQEILERATTYKHGKTKELASDLAKNKENVKYLKLFNEFTSPLSIRSIGLQNDITQAENFIPKKVETPVLITHSHVDKVVDFYHARSLKNKWEKSELYEYNGYGHAIWFGKEWNLIVKKTLEFLKEHGKNAPFFDNKYIKELTSETWVSKINGALLKINLNGEFSLDFPGVDEKNFLKGNCRFENNALIFKTKSGSGYCEGIEGKYLFEIKNNELLLKPVHDTCSYRNDLFSKGWFKI